MKKVLCLATTLILLFCAVSVSFQTAMHGQAEENTVYASTLDLGISPMGGTPLTVDTQRVDYAYKVEDEYINPYEIPGYISSYTCGISAGGNVFGYYDRLYEELIPNHTYKTFLGKFLYGSQGDEVDNVFSYLFSAMGGNPVGVTINQYQTGIKSYASSRGRTATFTKTMAGAGQLNSAQYKAALRSGKLLSIFLDGFSIIGFGDYCVYDGYDIVRAYTNSGAHIMVAYGFYEVSYYNSANQCFLTNSYLYVTSGYSNPSRCMVKLNQYCVIDDCYVTEIS